MNRTAQPAPLEIGRAYILDGKAYTVGLLNFSRARLDPLFRKRKVITSRLHDYSKTIFARPPSVNLSAGARLVPVLVEVRKTPTRKPADERQTAFRF